MIIKLSGENLDPIISVIRNNLEDYYTHKKWTDDQVSKVFNNYQTLVKSGLPRWGELNSGILSTKIAEITSLKKSDIILILDMIKLLSERNLINKKFWLVTDIPAAPVYVSQLQKEKPEKNDLNFDFKSLMEKTSKKISDFTGLPNIEDISKKIKMLGYLALAGAGIYFIGIPVIKKITKGG